MAIQTLSRGIKGGDVLSRSFGTGISDALSDLTERKINQLAAKKEREQWSAGALKSGLFTPEIANFLAAQDPKTRAQFASAWLKGGGADYTAQQGQPGAPQGDTQGLPEGLPPGVNKENIREFAKMVTEYAQQLQSQGEQPPQTVPEVANQQGGLPQTNNQIAQQLSGGDTQPQQAPQMPIANQMQQSPFTQPKMTPQKIFAKGFQDSGEERNQIAREKLDFTKSEASKKTGAELRKERSELVDAASKARKLAKESEKDISILRPLNNSGKLLQGPIHSGLESIGLGKFVRGNTQTETAQKLLEQWITNETRELTGTGKTATATLREALSRAQPTLANTQEGLDVLLDVKSLNNHIKDLEFNEIHKLINKNPEITKEDLEFRLAAAMDKHDEDIDSRSQKIVDKANKSEQAAIPPEDPAPYAVGAGYWNDKLNRVTHIKDASGQWVPYIAKG